VAHANNAKQQTQAFQLITGPLNDIGEMPETKRLGPAAALANGNLIMIPDGEVQVSMMQPSNQYVPPSCRPQGDVTFRTETPPKWDQGSVMIVNDTKLKHDRTATGSNRHGAKVR
jgi:hypothetical protein